MRFSSSIFVLGLSFAASALPVKRAASPDEADNILVLRARPSPSFSCVQGVSETLYIAFQIHNHFRIRRCFESSREPVLHASTFTVSGVRFCGSWLLKQPASNPDLASHRG